MDFSPLLGRIPPLLAQAPAPAPAAQFSGGVGGFLGHVGPVAIGAPAAVLSDGARELGPVPALGQHSAAIRAEFPAG